MPLRTRVRSRALSAFELRLAQRSESTKLPVMKFSIVLDRDESGVWVAECPAIPGCVSQGQSRKEALENIRAAIKLCLEVRSERGLPLTVEVQQVEVTI
jgi:predicted RNase H-like HicB family nuclease